MQPEELWLFLQAILTPESPLACVGHINLIFIFNSLPIRCLLECFRQILLLWVMINAVFMSTTYLVPYILYSQILSLVAFMAVLSKPMLENSTIALLKHIIDLVRLINMFNNFSFYLLKLPLHSNKFSVFLFLHCSFVLFPQIKGKFLQPVFFISNRAGRVQESLLTILLYRSKREAQLYVSTHFSVAS